MKVTLIYPSMGAKLRATQMEPLTMAALAGLTPKDVSISFWDDRIEDVPYDDPTDLAAISVQTFTAKRAYEIASEFRQRNIPVVLGGFHVSFLPDEALEYADAVVVGEAENLWPRVIEDARAKRLQKIYRSEDSPSLQGLTYSRDIFSGKRYLPIDLVEFGRGCPYACNFCSVSAFFNQRKRCRPVLEVIEEIRTIPRKHILFVDDNLVGDRERARELFKAMVPLKKRWIAQTGIEIAADGELLRLAAESGCYGLMIGFESLQERNLRQMGKAATYNQSNYEKAIRKIHDYGIKICASFLFGYDQDDQKVFKDIISFAVGNKFLLGLFNHLTPLPGTVFFQYLQDQQRLKHAKWWLSPGYRWGDVVYEPKGCSAEELSEGCRWSRKKFYSGLNILRRMTLQANARSPWVSMIANIMVRKEVSEKQGFLLGREKFTAGVPPTA